MKLRALRRQWDRFGRSDPLWAVLSLPEKRHGRWDEAEFFATGVREIGDVLEHARGLGFTLRRQRALDFGCGVGRLTQAIAPHFERTDGVDIAASMIALAERYNRHRGRCAYHLNERPDLGLFPDAAFTFAYSTLVLQHIPAELAKRYIGELLRVLAPGGLLVFHLPSEPFPEAERGAARHSRASGPLAPDGFVAELGGVAAAVVEAPAGAEAVLKLRVANRSSRVWPALAGASGRHRVAVGGRFLTPAGDVVDVAESRCVLPHDLPPAAAAEVFLRARLPPWAGEYVFEVDLLQEDVAWFHERSGRPPLRLACRAGAVAGGPAGPPRLRPRPPLAEPGAFQRRHPRLHFVLARLLRLPAVRNAARRAARAAAWLARSWWSRLCGAVARRLDPPMVMNGIPRREVLGLIEQHGGRLLEAEASELTFAGWQAYRYWVTRD